MQDSQLRLEDPDQQRLWADWVMTLLHEGCGVKQRGSGGVTTWNVTLIDEAVVSIDAGPNGDLRVDAAPPHEELASEVCRVAYGKVNARDFGAGAWWKTVFTTDMGLSGVTTLHMLRIMSEHNKRRLQGDWRLGADILLSFDQAEKGAVPLVVPKFNVTLVFRVPAPGHGPHSSWIAEQMATFVRAAATFATGAPLQGFSLLFPASVEEEAAARDKLHAASDLSVDGFPLWPHFMWLAGDGANTEALRRVQGALFAYEQAIAQQSEYVTLAALVSAIEALALPNQTWQDERVSARFVKVAIELCEDTIRSAIEHDNFQQAFGTSRSSKRFLRQLYDLRSKPLHTGFLQHAVSALPDLGGDGGIRVMLVSEITRAAISEFLRRPSSSLVGHPTISPAQVTCPQCGSRSGPP